MAYKATWNCLKLVYVLVCFSCTYAQDCETGWTGPDCQYRNIVYGSSASSNIGSSLNKVYDGQVETCSKQTGSGADPHITVHLQHEMPVGEILITFKDASSATGFLVYAGTSSVLSPETLCYTDPGDGLLTKQVSVMCTRRLIARYITVQILGSENKLELCEIEIPIGRRLSEKKPVEASSAERNKGAALANDGQIGTFYASMSETSPYWYVDLENMYSISTIELTTKDDFVAFFNGFHVHLSNRLDFNDAKLVYVHNSTASSKQYQYVIPLDSKVARFVRISLPGQSRKLILREALVLGDCLENYCGTDCSKLCFCADKKLSVEQKTEGTCPGDCKRNWRNNDGLCNTGICSGFGFGYQCKYSCHCTGRCDPWSGQCLMQSSCRRHYHGDNCQGYNVIANSQSALQGEGTSYKPAPATVDGFLETCSPELSGQDSSWFVTFDTEKTVDQVLIYVNDTSTTTYGIEVTIENGETSTTCDVSRVGIDGRYLGRCHNVSATHVRISTPNVMQICDVALLECPDGTFGPLCENKCLCLDGSACDKSNGTCPDGGCEAGYRGKTCSSECIPGTYSNNCSLECGQCYEGAHCDIFTGECPDTCQPGWQGGRCDVECFNGTYGMQCLELCGNCIDGKPCDKETGVCTDGCAAGFYTANCTVECPSGSFGYNCNETCGSCKYDDVCEPVNGHCLSGCIIGKNPPTCKEDCPHGTYGQDCAQLCGKCRDNNTCHVLTGVCEDGCDPGVYIIGLQLMCKRECPDRRYGYNCSRDCPEDLCEGENVCDKASGACLSGCLKPGYQSPFCESECYDGTYGQDCQSICGMCRNRAPCNKTSGLCPAGCMTGYKGPKCMNKDPQLSPASIAILVVGCLLAVAGLLGVAIGFWIYKKGSPPWVYLKRRKEEKSMRDEKAPRNLSIVSRVYENNITLESDPPKLKRTNSNASNYKLSEAKPRGTLALEDFWDYVQDKKSAKPEMVQQFKDLAVGLTHPCETAKRAQNLRKNRYKEIFAYDHTRVKLDNSPGDAGNDYINACFISGYNRPHMYIAAQGPTEDFVCDFWRMIWQKKCRKIVILTRLVEHNKVKCCQYWPDEGTKQYGAVSVEYKEAETFADFTIRTFSISVEGKDVREIRQFHFESWPDRNVPEYASSVVHFWNRVRTTDLKDNVPIVVHCSAGIGRTGTFISLDYLVEQANVEGYVNVFQCVQNLRHQRVNMVQNQDQYVFLYEALAEALFCPSSAIPCERFTKVYKNMLETDPKTKQSKLEMEYERIQHVTKFHESMRSSFYDNGNYKAANNSANKEKNRVSHILPNDMHRPWLITRVCDRNDYINAVYLSERRRGQIKHINTLNVDNKHSYREDKMFLLTQNPLPDTIVDFWRMVYENRVSSIVNLDRITNPSDIYWPKEGETLTFIPFTLHHLGETDHVTYTEINLRLQNAEEPHEKARILKVFECKFWMSEDRVPVGGETSILEVYEEVKKWQKTTGDQPIVVHCMNGATKSGLFCVVTSTLERMRQEREVALQQTIKQMRIRRHQIVPTYDQYKFCHDIIAEYLKGYDVFSNFYI